MDDTPAPGRYPTVPFGTLLGRALRLKCPRCGEAPMFSGLFATRERCEHCHFKFERDPGFFLGSIYVNYGLTALSITFLFVVLQFGFGWTSRELAIPLTIFCLLFPTLMFRHTRALWLAMDCNWDASAMEIDEETTESES
jgi:uncharacterized protein (DUF983 family)